MKLKLLLGMFAFLLAAIMFLGANQPAFAATYQDQSIQTIQRPLASQVGCNGGHTLKVYFAHSSQHLCYNGSGYVSVNIEQVDAIYAGDRTASIAWDDGLGDYSSAKLPITHRNYLAVQFTGDVHTLYHLYYIYLN